MQQVHLFISGFVQGIGFRAFIKSNARRLGLTGWVRNTEDGRVETQLQGNEEKIKEVIKLCKRGPFLAHVKDLVVNWEEIKEKFSNFTIISH